MAVEKFGASERFACKVLGQNRSALRKARPVVSFEEARLRAALRAIAGEHPAWGWRKARWRLLAQPEWAGRLDVSKVVADREVITLGFDGSRSRARGVTDATALIGCRVSDGHLFEPLPHCVWEQPAGAWTRR